MPIKVKGTEIVDDNRNIKNADGSQITGIVTSITAGENITINRSTGNVTISADTSDDYWKKDSVGIAATYKVGIGTTSSLDASLTLEKNLIFSGTNVKIGNRAGECYTEQPGQEGDHQVLIGVGAGACSTSTKSKCNVSLGYFADNKRCSLNAVSIGFFAHGGVFSVPPRTTDDVAIGYYSLFSHCCGSLNVSIGYCSGRNNSCLSKNIFIGPYSGHETCSSGFTCCNIFIGQYSGYRRSAEGISDNNIFLGGCSGFSYVGLDNVAVGRESSEVITGCNNVTVGRFSGNCINGSCNVAVGSFSGCCINGSCNVAVGQWSRYVCGSNNITIGSCTSYSTVGSNNTFIGYYSAYGVNGTPGSTQGSSNVFIGAYSGGPGTTEDNVFIGACSGNSACVKCNNVFIGKCTGCRVTPTNSSVFIGSYAKGSSGGVAIGYSSYSSGVAIGNDSSGGLVIGNQSSTNSNNNLIIGNQSCAGGESVIVGNNNTSLLANTISIGNSIGTRGGITIGHCANYADSGQTPASIVIGNFGACLSVSRPGSILIGDTVNCSGQSCSSIVIGNCSQLSGCSRCSVIIGNKAGCHAGHYCSVIIGDNAGNSASTTGQVNSNNIIIGRNAGVSATLGLIDIADKDNHIVIGNNDTTCFFTKLRATSSGGTIVCWNSSTFELFAATSSRRFKTNIRPFLGGIKETLELNPVIYNSIEESEEQTQVGFIAEEVDEVEGLKDFVVYDTENKPLSLSYDRMVALLTNSVKELHEKNIEIKERLLTLETTVSSHIQNHP